ncbi:methyl-accepting chemotaxis protein [Sphingomonas sp. Sphisp140]|uniref:methyl-accepting chemotaxis protein n=1 Tax=unclassified Sphingomonas TaxID=196159 RepID=UPI0039B078EA
MSLDNIPIKRKLLLAFAGILAVFGLVGAVVVTNLSGLRRAADDKEHSLRAMAHVQTMMSNVLEQQNAARAFALLGTEAFVDDYRAGYGKFQQAVAAFRQDSTSAEQLGRVDKLVADVQALREKLDRVIALARNPATRAEAARLSGVKMLGDIRATVGAIDTTQQQRVDMRIEAEDAAAASAFWAIWVGGAISLALAGLLGWLLSRGIAKPVAEMTGAMNRLAGGDNGIDVPGTRRGDEIGAMAKAVLVFRDAAIVKEAADVAKQAADAEQQKVVETLAVNLGKLAQGDLTSEIVESFSPAYESVKTNFNAALQELRTLIGRVMESTATIQTGSGEIAQASEDLARRTEANAASLEETSAAVSQMDGRLKATAQAAERTVARADGAIATVAGGRGIADDAVQAMTRVADSAKGIDSVIEGLDKIAFQTRVLAMNAAVEAGRAGEAGRGFAVVADLVSALAMRAEEEAGRARDQLTATQSDIVSAVEMVQRVDGALAGISADVGEVHTLLAQMASDNQAQSTAISEIATAVGTMDQTTQQNAAMVEQTSAAARNLSSEVTALGQQASKFDLGTRATGRTETVIRAGAAAQVRFPQPVSSAAMSQDWATF